MILGTPDDARREIAVVKRRRTVGGETTVGGRQVGIAEDLTDARSLARRQIDARGFLVRAQERLAAFPLRCRDLGNRKSLFRDARRRRQQIAERQAAEPLVQPGPRGDRARYRHRVDSGLRHARRARGGKALDRERRRCPAAAVDAVKRIRRRVVDQCEQIAADAVHHRRDDPHRGVDGDRRVDGVTTACEDRGSGLGGERMLAGRDAARGDDHRSSLCPVDRGPNVVGRGGSRRLRLIHGVELSGAKVRSAPSHPCVVS